MSTKVSSYNSSSVYCGYGRTSMKLWFPIFMLRFLFTWCNTTFSIFFQRIKMQNKITITWACSDIFCNNIRESVPVMAIVVPYSAIWVFSKTLIFSILKYLKIKIHLILNYLYTQNDWKFKKNQIITYGKIGNHYDHNRYTYLNLSNSSIIFLNKNYSLFSFSIFLHLFSQVLKNLN